MDLIKVNPMAPSEVVKHFNDAAYKLRSKKDVIVDKRLELLKVQPEPIECDACRFCS